VQRARVLEPLLRVVGSLSELRQAHQLEHRIDALVDGEAVRVQREVVVVGVGPLQPEVAADDRRMRLVVGADLGLDLLRIVGAEALHHPGDPHRHRRADARADDVRHGVQQMRCAPAADDRALAAAREIDDLLRGMQEQAGVSDESRSSSPALPSRSRTTCCGVHASGRQGDR
jgi:hypothetical protein